MHPDLPNARFERKLVAGRLSAPEVLALVRRHPAGFREVYPERLINNIYLDSPSLASYHEHVNGAPQRRKVRVRWYGEAQGPVEIPILEHKFKQGAVSGKLGHRLAPMTLDGAPVQAALDEAFAHPSLPDAARASVRHLEPSLFNRYRRRYFVSADHRFRLTVDWALQFFRLRKASGAPRHLVAPAPLVVVELKYAPGNADAAAGITNEFPFRVRRCSKYVLGIGGGH